MRFCKTCNEPIDIEAKDYILDGECLKCNDAYWDSISTDRVGIRVWPSEDDNDI